ncbi:hypothetical protein ACHAXR_009329 [Thalassiosira sp. AJA248-18]
MNSTAINLFVSFATLLSGDQTDCLDPANITDETCAGGLASVASVIRHSQQRGDGPAVHIPKLDRVSKFVQNAYFDHETGTTYIHIGDETQPLAAPAVDSLTAALDYVANLNTNSGCFQPSNIFNDGIDEEAEHGDLDSRCSVLTSRCWSPIVLFNTPNKELYTACLEAALNHQHPPLVFYDVHDNNVGYNAPEIVNNSTVVFNLPDSTDVVSHLRIEVGQYDMDKRRSITNMKFSETDLDNLPLELKDDDYIKDQKYLRNLADQAIENDPIVGRSGYMPFTRFENWRMCMGGECPIGNLFADGMRWATGADFAVTPSGGLRGTGWEEGPVHVGDLWTAFPFMNYICTGIMSGVSIYRLLNYSTAVSTFESTYTPMGDRLLQMSGMRMTYNTLVDGSGPGRLMAVEMWNKDKNSYVPLERLRLYRFATDSWMCNGFDPYPSLFGSELQIDGEVPGVVDMNMNVQSKVGDYLMHLNTTYDTSIQGRLVNDTEAFEPLDFIQTPESCLVDYFWDNKVFTCMSCPGGKHVQFSDDLVSFLITNDSNDSAGRNVLYNREMFDVTIAPKSAPSWLIFQNATNDLIEGSFLLQPGESVAINFDVDPSVLAKGSTRSTVSYGVVIDGEYPGCLTDLDITFDVLVELRAEENFNHIEKIRPAGLSLMALAMALSIFFSCYTFKERKHRVIRASQPLFLQLICAGTFIMASSIIPLSIDDGIGENLVQN